MRYLPRLAPGFGRKSSEAQPTESTPARVRRSDIDKRLIGSDNPPFSINLGGR